MPGLEVAFERIGEAVEHHLPQTHAAGFALAVTDAEDVLGVVVRGLADVGANAPVRPETRFEIGSISKSFAGIIAIQEAEAGRLNLEVSVNELLPWLGLAEPFGPITLHHLMTHTSGLPIGTEESPTGPGALAILRTLAPTTPPGECFWYSNDGWKLVGAVLERLTRTPMRELLRERILAPLGMTSSEGAIVNETRLNLAAGYEPVFDDRPPHLGHPLAPARWIVSNTADGSIVSNVIDMSAYVRMLLGRGRTLVGGHETTILSPAGFDRFVEPRVPMDEPGARQGERYGYGVWTSEEDGRTFVTHSGGMVGYTALLMVDVDTGIGAIALQNGGGDKKPVVRYALEAVRAALRGEPVVAMPHPPAATAIANAASLAGTYVGDREIELVATDDGLRFRDGAIGVDLERWPDADDAFLVPHPTRDRYLLRVLRDPGGTVTELVHGPDRFAPAGRALVETPALPAGWDGREGLYRSNNPWAPTLRIFARGGGLWCLSPPDGVEERLTPLDDGSFAVGEPATPQRLTFLDEIEGVTTILGFNGGRWYRALDV
ncbi:MAG: serine hydrolase domain-containing protein [Actinomycetota bacterium]